MQILGVALVLEIKAKVKTEETLKKSKRMNWAWWWEMKTEETMNTESWGW